MTRITGSVPDGRITSRPLARPAARSAASIALTTGVAGGAGSPLLVAHVLEDLRQRLEAVADLGDRPLLAA
jgi:hypothetical protein